MCTDYNLNKRGTNDDSKVLIALESNLKALESPNKLIRVVNDRLGFYLFSFSFIFLFHFHFSFYFSLF